MTIVGIGVFLVRIGSVNRYMYLNKSVQLCTSANLMLLLCAYACLCLVKFKCVGNFLYVFKMLHTHLHMCRVCA